MFLSCSLYNPLGSPEDGNMSLVRKDPSWPTSPDSDTYRSSSVTGEDLREQLNVQAFISNECELIPAFAT